MKSIKGLIKEEKTEEDKYNQKIVLNLLEQAQAYHKEQMQIRVKEIEELKKEVQFKDDRITELIVQRDREHWDKNFISKADVKKAIDEEIVLFGKCISEARADKNSSPDRMKGECFAYGDGRDTLNRIKWKLGISESEA